MPAPKKLLTIDLTKEESSRQILPSDPILSSSKIGWIGIQLKHYHQLPPHQIPEYCPTQHLILTHNMKRPFSIERILDGRFQREQMMNRDITIVPANVSHSASWKTNIDVTALILDPVLVAQVAYDSIEPDRIELLPHFSQTDPLVSQIGLALKTELEFGDSSSRFYADAAATMLAVHLLRRYSGQTNKIHNEFEKLSKSKLRRVIEYLHDHLVENVSLDALANESGMSRFRLTRLFKQSTGLSPYQYLVRRRLEKVKELLANTDLTIAEIAQQSGFASQSHMSRMFRKYLSTTPKIYRQLL